MGIGKRNFYVPKNEELERLMEQLTKNSVACVKPKTSHEFTRNKIIQKLREKDGLYIGYDTRKRMSIMNVPPHIKIKKKERKYFFEFLLIM